MDVLDQGSLISSCAGDSRERAREFDYALAFDNAIVGVCFMESRRFVHVNHRMEEMFGYGADELAGRSVRLVYANDEDYDTVGRMYPSLSRNNRYCHEKPMVRKGGEIIWCTISGRALDPSDPFASSVWIVQDITARKLAENRIERSNQRLEQSIKTRTLNLQRTNQALREEVERRRAMEREMLESREKYRVLFRNIPVGIVITDKDGRIVEVNRTMQTLTATGSAEELFAAADDPSRVISAAGESMSLHQFVNASIPADGRRIGHSHILWRTLGISPAEFDVVGVRLHVRGLGAAFTFEDTSERKRARDREREQQEQLAHAGRLSLMGQFASELAHELSQPLNACQSYIAGLNHRLARESIDKGQLQEGLDRIAQHLEQASKVVSNVRAFVARTRPEAETVDFNQLVRQTLDLLDFQLRSAAVSISVVSAGPAVEVQANRIEMQQVLVNLIVNSIEAMKEVERAKRTIEIKISRQRGGRIQVRVSDNGPGIAPTLSKNIFEPYYSTKPRGLGLGLMICRTIVESHGGVLQWVDSPKGAIFQFSLPRQ